jgi:hypothetical protein
MFASKLLTVLFFLLISFSAFASQWRSGTEMFRKHIQEELFPKVREKLAEHSKELWQCNSLLVNAPLVYGGRSGRISMMETHFDGSAADASILIGFYEEQIDMHQQVVEIVKSTGLDHGLTPELIEKIVADATAKQESFRQFISQLRSHPPTLLKY